MAVTPSAAGSHANRRASRRRWRLLLLVHCLKSIWLGLTFQWDRLAPEWRLWRERILIERSQQFDKAWYLARNPDVAKANEDPILHYLQKGAVEGRN